MENKIRNFAIIAHVDHGKSTLADRFLELTGTVEKDKHEEQLLDRNPISRERGITIKLAPVTMTYQDYTLNLIDTPGHVDFSYEVDRTLACVEGVILLVDVTQGIQAQTIANAYKAIEKNLVIIPAINKIDLQPDEVNQVKKQIVDFLGIDEKEIFLISAKTGQGTTDLLKAVVNKIPPPKNITDFNSETKALIFDSYYDSHQGVIAFVRIFNGQIKKGDQLRLINTGHQFEAVEVGFFKPELKPGSFLDNGQIGYVVTNLKDIHQVRVGDTITKVNQSFKALSGYRQIKPMVFASIFPTDTAEYLNLKKALEKLSLNDSSLKFSSIYSRALGSGFRVGFLGLLHADVVRERLEREFGLSLVLTAPQVEFKVEGNQTFEPYVKLMIISPKKYMGEILQLCQQYRATFVHMDSLGHDSLDSVQLVYQMPMSELMSDFFDQLKSVSSGFASLDWEFFEYRPVKAAKLELRLNNDLVDEFSEMVVEERAYERGYFLTRKLKELIPRQQFEVRIQAVYRGKVIASTRIPPYRKDVLVKSGKVLGTGDIGRKKKLLERQKEGKKRMKMVGQVEIPKDAFFKIFKSNRRQ